MTIRSVNPATGECIQEYREHSMEECFAIIEQADAAWRSWREIPIAERAVPTRALGRILTDRKRQYGELITREMGKLLRETEPELDKSALACAFYADRAEEMLEDRLAHVAGMDSRVVFEPLGVILAVMPWNFPFWQFLRFAVPALMGGNGVALKHASNVTGCALALEEAFVDAGFPENLVRALVVGGSKASGLIAHPAIRGVTLTGSEGAGRAVSVEAGKHLKKVVMELGGSDPFIVLEDADLDVCCPAAAKARLMVSGQVCLAAKRYLVHESLAEEFTERMKTLFEGAVPGDPMDPASTLGPLARADLAPPLEKLARESVAQGAKYVVKGGPIDGPGNFYGPTLLADVRPGMPVCEEETFGPVGCIITVRDEAEAVEIANNSRFGLGASVWTANRERALSMARRLECGSVAINSITKSHPALPFGGVKDSGHGREMGRSGLMEFMNVKTIRIA